MTTEELILKQSGLLGRASYLADAVINNEPFTSSVAFDLRKDINALFDELEEIADDK